MSAVVICPWRFLSEGWHEKNQDYRLNLASFPWSWLAFFSCSQGHAGCLQMVHLGLSHHPLVCGGFQVESQYWLVQGIDFTICYVICCCLSVCIRKRNALILVPENWGARKIPYCSIRSQCSQRVMSLPLHFVLPTSLTGRWHHLFTAVDTGT